MAEARLIRQFNAILTKLDLQELKREYVFTASNARTTSTKDLYDVEITWLIDNLNKLQGDKQEKTQTWKDVQKWRADRMRKKILHYCHMMHWYKTGTHELDFHAIDEFCIKRGHAHKQLNQYKYSELPTLVSQFEEVYKHFLSKI